MSHKNTTAELAKAGYKEIFIVPPGIGDGIMANAVARAYHRQFGKPMPVGHCFPELFENDPDVICLPEFAYYRYSPALERLAASYGITLKCLHYCNFREISRNRWLFYYPGRPLPEMMAEQAGISGEFEFLPRMYLTPQEKENGKRFAEKQIAILSTGRDLYKSWQTEKFQAVVDAFPEYHFIQLGDKNDPPLKHVLNLQGKLSLRESAAVLAGSDLFIGLVGALMHMARAVDCPSVILCPACEPGDRMYYPEFSNLCAEPVCRRCFQEQIPPGSCGIAEHCTGDIPVERVVSEVRTVLSGGRDKMTFRKGNVIPHPVSGMEMYKMRESEIMAPVRVYYGKQNCLTRWLVMGPMEYFMTFEIPADSQGKQFDCIEIEKRGLFAVQFQSLDLWDRQGNVIRQFDAELIQKECKVRGGKFRNGICFFRYVSDGIRLFLPEIPATRIELRFCLQVREKNEFLEFAGFYVGRKWKKIFG